MRNFYRNFLKLCSMLVLQNVVTLSVNLADNIMLGAFSETALSGVTTVNQVQFVFQQLIMALGDGLVIFGSQYWGKKETKPVRKISAWAMCTGIFIALILFILASFFPRRLLGLFTTDQTIIEAGLSYLAIIRFTYFFFAVTQILLATLRCVEIAGIAFGLSVMTLIINCSIGHHGKNHRFRRPEACKALFQKTSETFCSHGNYLRRAAFLYPYSGLKPLPAFSGNQRNGEYISYYLKRGDVGNVLSDAYQWRHYSGKWQYCLKVDLISTWAIVIPLSMFMAFVVKASPAIVVCCLNADQIFKCVPAFLKCNYGHWIKTMTNIS